MTKIKVLLDKEIGNGSINWNKLQNSIHAALPMLEKQYNASTAEGKPIKATIADALTFSVTNPETKEKKCYKLFTPRFINADLYCFGIQIGICDNTGKPIFISPARAV
jgi:hypothetical protein